MTRYHNNIKLPDFYDSELEEKKIIRFWSKRQIPKQTNELRRKKNNGNFLVLNGPVFPTGYPHSGHILNAVVKDVFMRYAQQKNLQVDSKFGWDCHGLPVEYEVDKRLEINSPQGVYNIGIAAYNEECKKFVQRNKCEWKNIYERIGSWADLTVAYETMSTEYMEGVWKVFKELYEKGLVYKDTKVLPYSTACHTNLSNFEAQQNLNDVSEVGMTISVNICNSDEKLLVWTTTPWSLLIGSSLCVNPKTTYVKIKTHQKNKQEVVYLVSKSRLEFVFKNPRDYTILEEVSGDALEHLKCEPLFDYNHVSRQFKISMDCSISDDVGTGIVPLEQLFVESLTERGHVFNIEEVKYKKSCCWRSQSPLVRKEIESWFVRVDTFIEQLAENVAKNAWLPCHKVKEDFLSWLKEHCMDWSVSRTRFWGTPIPIWVSPSGDETICVGSIEELEQLTGKTNIIDLHRESVDWLRIPSRVTGNPPLRRVTEVFDCWFDSAAMPLIFSNTNQADMVAEGYDQTRGWFYTMLVLSTALSKPPPFRNIFATGLVVEPNGYKVSKRKHNPNDYIRLIEKYGTDCFRLYLLSSPLVECENLSIKEEGVAEIAKKITEPFYRIFKQCTSQLGDKGWINYGYMTEWYNMGDLIDKWILSLAESLFKFYDAEMKAYRIHTILPRVIKLIQQIEHWYMPIQRPTEPAAIHTSSIILFNLIYKLCIMLAPFAPFITEYMYQFHRDYMVTWRREESIHQAPYYLPCEELIRPDLELGFSRVQTVVQLVHALRAQHIVPIRYQINEIIVLNYSNGFLRDVEMFKKYIMKLVNAGEVRTSKDCHQFGASLKCKLVENLTFDNKKKIASTLQGLGREDIESFIQEGSVKILERIILLEDVHIFYEIEKEADTQYALKSKGDVLVVMKMNKDLIYYEEGLMKEFVRIIQNFKRRQKYYINEFTTIHYFTKDECMQNLFAKHGEYLKKKTNSDFKIHENDSRAVMGGGCMEITADLKGCPMKLFLGEKCDDLSRV